MGVVLIVEDDPELREMLVCLLEISGFQTRVARDGAVALMEARRLPHPHVILLDLMMPVMDGWEFRRRQLADHVIATIPVVLVSALSSAHHRDLAAAAVVGKPCDFDHLLAVVRRFV
jgi:CheY-like chemotaxis protein